MITRLVFHGVGKGQALLYRLPLVGEPAVRGLNRALAHAAFRLPVLGGRKGRSIEEVRDGWLGFLARAGIRPRITGEEESAFHWEVEACPYGYCRAGQRGVCDAVMDLDRTYTRLLGGELVITDRIPDGAEKCRYTTRLASA